VSLKNFIVALSLPNVGPSQAKAMADYFKTPSNFVEGFNIPERILNIDGIGAKTATSIQQWSCNEANMNEMMDLIKCIVFTEDEPIQSSNDLLGKVFSITGKLNMFGNRDALIEDIEKHGGKFSSVVNKKVRYLINNDSTSKTSKNLAARKLGVEIITEKEYLEMVGGEE
jgi:DNA ligase (NAD+)